VDEANVGKTLETMCATREARKFANYVEVFLAGSQQVSTLDAVRGILAERGGLKPQVLSKPCFTREIAAIAFTTASFQSGDVKSREVP
jgi:hypothetical protein